MKYLGLIILLLTFSGCKTYSDDELSSFDKQIETYLKKNNIECQRSSSGLYYNIINEGEGRTIQFKDVVSFKYTGKLLDGTTFDKKTKPIEYKVEQLIGAWKEIMLELKEGGEAYLISPPQLGYGTHDLDDIPPNSILIFEIEVIEVK